MKIHIIYEFREGPWGGGNTFLKNLRRYLQEKGKYSDDPNDADVLLVNSHHDLPVALRLKSAHPGKILVHRIDGPISCVRKRNRLIDAMIHRFNKDCADATIFQSQFSRKRNVELGYLPQEQETTIYNSPDKGIFRKKRSGTGKKVRLITTSWSPNWKKGFKTYDYLDRNLDFSRYEYVFVGNSPIRFKNIRMIPPLPSRDLAAELRKADVFITASESDPCSNSLIEALASGLPAVALADGGHPEIVGKGGELFKTPKECLQKIEIVRKKHGQYSKNLPRFDAPPQYLAFMQSLKSTKRPGLGARIRLSLFRALSRSGL